jgi:hypothetical protein
MGGRQKRWREATRAAGLIEVTVIVPAESADALREYAAALRDGLAPAVARQKRRGVADLAQTSLDLLPPVLPEP